MEGYLEIQPFPMVKISKDALKSRVSWDFGSMRPEKKDS
jgi:hypothetical protein